jgi:hypothetical protein
VTGVTEQRDIKYPLDSQHKREMRARDSCRSQKLRGLGRSRKHKGFGGYVGANSAHLPKKRRAYLCDPGCPFDESRYRECVLPILRCYFSSVLEAPL